MTLIAPTGQPIAQAGGVPFPLVVEVMKAAQQEHIAFPAMRMSDCVVFALDLFDAVIFEIQHRGEGGDSSNQPSSQGA